MAKKKNIQVDPEWSHMIDVAELDSEQARLSISPNDEERALLARRLGVQSLETLEADLTIHKGEGGFQVYVQGALKAEVVQQCVVTGDPVDSTIEDEFEGWFADQERAVNITQAKNKIMMQKGQTEIQMVEEQDDPEPIIDGQIDLGELTTQYLALAINPYPHKDGAQHDVTDEDTEVKGERAPERENPFAALKGWKARHGTGDDSETGEE